MPKQLQLSCIVDLPDNVLEAARATIVAWEPWERLLADLKAAGVKHAHTSEQVEVRAKVERAPRRAKLVATMDAAEAQRTAKADYAERLAKANGPASEPQRPTQGVQGIQNQFAQGSLT